MCADCRRERPQAGCLTQQALCSHSSGGSRGKILVLSGLSVVVCGEGSLPGWQAAAFSHVLTGPPSVLMCGDGVSSRVSLPFLTKAVVLASWGPALTPSFNRDALPRGPISKHSRFGGWASTQEFWGHSSVYNEG